ncbi:hypothetical protein ACFLYF_02035 [Chloroflexota bacterium]
MSTVTCYQNTFGGDTGLNLGLILSVVLITLMIFLELSRPVVGGKTIASLSRLRISFSTVTWLLFIVFAGIAYTSVVMVLSG